MSNPEERDEGDRLMSTPEEREEVDRALSSFLQKDRGAPLARRGDGENVVDFSDAIGLYESIPTIRKLLLLVLLLALKEKASGFRFEPWVTDSEGLGLRMFHEVDGELYELLPPPQYLAAEILREIKAVVGFDSPRRRLAGLIRRLANKLDDQTEYTSQSRFRVRSGDDIAEISATLYPSPAGDRVFLEIAGGSESLSRKAQDAMEAIFERRRS